MSYKNCANCNQSNSLDMRFCINCGAEFSPASANELPPTVFVAGSFDAISQGGQNFQTPNFQQPDFRQQNYQQPNFQTPNFQTVPPAGAGGQTKIILLGGGLLLGLIMLALGGVKLYSVFGNSSSSVIVSPTPQNLYSNTANTAKPTVPSPNSSGLATSTRQTIGKWSLRETVPDNPEKDGFAGATEENQLKYYDPANNFLHVTIAAFPADAAAKGNLRLQMQKFKSLNLKVTPEDRVADNGGNEIGISQTMTSANGKIHAIYWTRKNILVRVLGPEKDTEDFFEAY